VIQGDFHRLERAKAIRASGHYSNYVVEALDDAAGDFAFGAEPVPDEGFMSAGYTQFRPGLLTSMVEGTKARYRLISESVAVRSMPPEGCGIGSNVRVADHPLGIQPKRGDRKRTSRREAEIRWVEADPSCKLPAGRLAILLAFIGERRRPAQSSTRYLIQLARKGVSPCLIQKLAGFSSEP
jgi:hypothetical protein